MKLNKPLVSVILLSYNQENYINSALESIFNQSYENIEYIISDDCSIDNTKENILLFLSKKGIKKNINILDNNVNLGLAGNFNKAITYARGDIILLAAGDDISLPDRVENTVKYFECNNEISFLSFNDYVLLGDKKTNNQIHNITNDLLITFNDYFSSCDNFFSGASRAFKREVYDLYGPLNNACPTEDTPYIFRALTLGCGFVSSKPGIYYRKHENNLSSPSGIRKMSVSEIDMQYKTDISRALKNNIIDIEKVNLFNDWIEFKNITKQFGITKGIGNRFFLMVTNFIKNKLFRQWTLNKIYEKLPFSK